MPPYGKKTLYKIIFDKQAKGIKPMPRPLKNWVLVVLACYIPTHKKYLKGTF
jgi:hypothetical protein